MDKVISEKVENAICKLFKRDRYLLQNNLNERTIAHKFAMYLQEEFIDYDVDCEYNKNVDEKNGAKNIYILEEELDELRSSIKYVASKRHEETKKLKQEFAVISIYPDILVHKRGNNERNLLIIEIKKSTNLTDREFDFKKLQCYTEKSEHNKLHYKYGLFIEFITGQKEPGISDMIWYSNGCRIIQKTGITDNTEFTV